MYRFDKKVETNVQTSYLNSKVFVLPFANGSTLEDMLSVINTYLSELSPYAGSKSVSTKNTDKLLADNNNGFELKRVSSNSSTSSLYSGNVLPENFDTMKKLVVNDNIEDLRPLLGGDGLNQRGYLILLSKSVTARAKKCINLVLDYIETLEDKTELNGRNIIHRMVVSQGRQVFGDEGKEQRINKTVIYPAEFPQPSTNIRGEGPSESNPESELESLIYLLDCLRPRQKSAIISRDQYDRTPLHYSAQYGLKQMTRVLLKYMKDWELLIGEVNFDTPVWQDSEHETPLQLAVSNEHPKTTQVILENNSPGITTKNESGYLLVAAMKGNVALLEVLLDHGFDINYADQGDNETSLFIGSKMNHKDAVKFLVDSGANTEIAEKTYGWTPIFVAAVDGYLDVAKVLLHDGKSDIVRTDESGWTAMEHAALRGHLDLADLLKPPTMDIYEPFPTREKTTSPSAASDSAVVGDAEDGSTNTSNNKFMQAAKVKSGKEISNTRLTSSASPVQNNNNNNIHINSNPVVEPIKTFGHRYLKDQTMILLTLGSTDSRITTPILELDAVPYSKAYSTRMDTALSLIVSTSESKEEPVVLDLPMSEAQPTEPISFFVDGNDVSNVKLFFDLVPTYAGNKQKVLGRAVALLPNVYTSIGEKKRSLHQTLTLPIVGCENMEVLGKIHFGFLIVEPFSHPNMEFEKSSTYWKSLITTRVIGHRGLGKNSTSKKSLQLGENTLESFIQAANLGASYVEFDVQLTKDHVPVIYHDFLVAETGMDVPMQALTLEQFLAVSKAQEKDHRQYPSSSVKSGHQITGSNRGRNAGTDGEAGFTERRRKSSPTRARSVSMVEMSGLTSSSDNINGSHDHTNDVNGNGQFDEYDMMRERMKFTRDYKTKGFKGNYRGHSIQSPFTTLEEVFKNLPDNVGFNIECKYPMLDESQAEDMENFAIELNTWCDTLLNLVYNHGAKRDIIFSSFNPDICLMLSLKQPSFPVLYLTEAGTQYMADIRASSLQEGIRFAKRWDLLGIVSAARPLIQCPRLVNVVKESGLVCVTYGTDNNDPENARLQLQSGVDAVIVDSVLAVRRGLTVDQEK